MLHRRGRLTRDKNLAKMDSPAPTGTSTRTDIRTDVKQGPGTMPQIRRVRSPRKRCTDGKGIIEIKTLLKRHTVSHGHHNQGGHEEQDKAGIQTCQKEVAYRETPNIPKRTGRQAIVYVEFINTRVRSLAKVRRLWSKRAEPNAMQA